MLAFGCRWRSAHWLAIPDMHHCDVVGIEAPPAQEVVEQYHRWPSWRDQGPGDAVFAKQLRELIALQLDRLRVALDERVAVKIPSVDKGLDTGKDQVAAKIVVVEHRPLDMSRPNGGERRGRCDLACFECDGAAQQHCADRQQNRTGKRYPAHAR